MSRPRTAALASATAASVVAFLVMSRWRLAGTLTGAVIIPLVYTLISHWSSQSVDHAASWLRRRVFRGGQAEETTRVSVARPASVVASHDKGQVLGLGAAAKSTISNRRSRQTQWLLVCFASLALAVSIYALASRGPGEKVVVHDIVVQKATAVTTQAAESGLHTAAGTTSTEATGAADVGTSSTTVATTSPGQTVQTGQSPSTTIAPVSTTTSLPSSSTTTVPPNTTTSGP